MKQRIGYIIAGIAAGAANGLLGAGGGMLLIPLLTFLANADEDTLFPTSVAIVLPICLVSLTISPGWGNLPWREALPYLLGGIPGGLLAGLLDGKIPVKWLHRGLGVIILIGGVRYLC